MADCIFCKIVAGTMPAEKIVHEGGAVVSFRDIKPVRPGHTLLVPAEHYAWFWELPDGLADRLFRAARTLAPKLKQEMGADYVQLSIVGKDVPHVHMHLIPRSFGDEKTLP